MKNTLSQYARFVLTLGGTLVISACAPVGQQIPLKDTVTAETLNLPAGQTALIYASWWQALQQPVLNHLIDTALQHAPDLQIAQARLQQAEAQWQGTEGQAGIQVGLQASGNAIYIDPAPAIPSHATNHVLQNGMVAAAVNYSLDFWGKHRSLIQSALGQKEAAQWQLAQSQLILSQAIVAQYTQWQLLDTQLAITTKRISVNEQLQRLLASRVKTGLLPASATYAQSQAILALQALQRQLTAERERVLHSIAILTGQSPTVLSPTSIQFSAIPSVTINGLRADILGQRPDIAAQRALLQSRYFGIQAAKAEFYPNIELKGLAGLSHIDAFDVLTSTSRILGFMPAITLPIFTSGQLQANLSSKQAQYNEQVAVYNKTVLTALQQAADAISDYQQSYDAVVLQKQAWQVAQKAANAGSLRQQAGLENGLSRLQAEDAALSAQSTYWQTYAWQQQSWNNLQVALGGGITQQATSGHLGSSTQIASAAQTSNQQ
ncbi:efflux transporter outer membrane subunit [Pelistega europaea]|uniref:Efflux transporter outer membrane subunit n=1 Tax=Pelistega europaea TaxID=106147 RepID=A0A7Y4L885_9BURK|nr:efflux transporter outer membrane subunit [Pelistega europaea]NOL48752.1 efflux transporter outer membrane subunit [Pelistega europaea]